MYRAEGQGSMIANNSTTLNKECGQWLEQGCNLGHRFQSDCIKLIWETLDSYKNNYKDARQFKESTRPKRYRYQYDIEKHTVRK